MTVWSWLLIGAASWGLALLLKILADLAVRHGAKADLGDAASSVLSGVWSSVCELGLAALALWYWSAGPLDALALAAGAALSELILLLPAMLFARSGRKISGAGAKAERQAFLFERSVALANHLAARMLLWLGVAGTAGWKAAAAAFGLFALSEGLQAFGQARDWDYLNPRTLWTSLFVQTAIVAAECALILLWWQAVPAG